MAALSMQQASDRRTGLLTIVWSCLLALAALGVSACLPRSGDRSTPTSTVQPPQPTAAPSIAGLRATFEANTAATEQVLAATEQVHAVTADAAKSAGPTCSVYDDDPTTLWNRLFCVLYVGVDEDGETVGADDLDFCCSPDREDRLDRLVEEPHYGQVLATTDEFLRTNGESLDHSVLERGFLQRDVWNVADALSIDFGQDSDPTLIKRRRILLSRLVPIIRRLAMSRAAIDGLPNNLDQAIASQEFPAIFDAMDGSAAVLPSDLAADNGPWKVLGRAGGPLAMAHLEGLISATSHAARLVMMHGSGDRGSAEAFLAILAATKREDASALIVPPGTMFALVSRMTLIDETGTIVPSPVVEEVQLRRYDSHPYLDHFFVAFRVSRARLFRGDAGGMVKEVAGWEAEECAQCHAPISTRPNSFTRDYASASSINSFSRPFTAEKEIQARPGPLRATTVDNELAESARWLMAQPGFAVLKKVW